MTDPSAPWPTELRVSKDRQTLTVGFNTGERHELSAEYLRVCSPSAEVQGHEPSQKKTVPGKRRVEIIKIEPAPGGVAIEMAAPDAAALARLRGLQPALDAAVERAGLVVVRWSFRTGILPAGSAHATLAAEDAAEVLTLPVFRAVAELALMLPAQG